MHGCVTILYQQSFICVWKDGSKMTISKLNVFLSLNFFFDVDQLLIRNIDFLNYSGLQNSYKLMIALV